MFTVGGTATQNRHIARVFINRVGNTADHQINILIKSFGHAQHSPFGRRTLEDAPISQSPLNHYQARHRLRSVAAQIR
jgi:hypothetical protein